MQPSYYVDGKFLKTDSRLPLKVVLTTSQPIPSRSDKDEQRVQLGS